MAKGIFDKAALQEMAQARAERRAGDEKRLAEWIDTHGGNAHILNVLANLKTDQFAFGVERAFVPAVSAQTDPTQDYVAPSLQILLKLTVDKTLAEMVTVTVDPDCKFTFVPSAGEDSNGATKAALNKSLVTWLGGLRGKYHDLNMDGHLTRALAATSKDNKPRSKAA